ncbi:hypothetical protein FB567DRAFT_624728 [Paraphoma chrysanthemicola]|uniref:Uncharacterized protein n=1 Tax=Paraphoma chrysanthemicola TaxID=798071 RepID=A0A8K0W2T8_9PLEO|nr:hypothetical protein FB567DRAFT_624728 [Paraphoma chrysanthemicola]
MNRPQTRKIPSTFHEAPDELEPPDKPTLHQQEYRSFGYNINIWHYRDVRYPLDLLRKFFVRRANGYNFVGSFIGSDTIAHFRVPDGDEVPRGYMEVAYLANAFSNSHGCALGFRRDDNVIEWFCTQEIHKEYNLHPDHKWRMFTHVAWTGKGVKGRCVKGANPEHRAWWESLDGARPKLKTKLQLSWHSKYWDLVESGMNGDIEHGVEYDDEEEEQESDEDMMDIS